MPKKLRATGRRTGGYKKRTFGKKRTNRRLYGKSAVGSFAATPLYRYPYLPNEYRVRLPFNLNSAIQFESGKTYGHAYWQMYAPGNNPTGSNSRLAGGFLHLMSMYLRAYVVRSSVKVRIVNEYALGLSTIGDVALHTLFVTSAVIPYKNAIDFSAVELTMEELQSIPGAKDDVCLPQPGDRSVYEFYQSVDIAKFIGGSRTDHTQGIYVTESVTTNDLLFPSNASAQNLPALIICMRRNTTSLGQASVPVQLVFEFDVQFENLRPLENTSSQLKPWAL